MSDGDHYATLGLGREASDEEIRKAFRRLALQHHPDKNPGDAQAAARFRRIAEAYRVLGDQAKRVRYDSHASHPPGEGSDIEPYIHLHASARTLELNEEFVLTYSFPAEGRAFRKPTWQGWEITAGPAVSHRYREGVRETVLQYTASPLRTGLIEIQPARIQFHGRSHYSGSLSFQVNDTACYFADAQNGGSDPVRIRLYKLHDIRYTRFTKTVVVPRTVLIPRSDLAAWYHRIGRLLKSAIPLLGAVLCMLKGIPVLPGMAACSLFAGLNVRIMYRLVGVRPRSGNVLNHPRVVKCLSEGYFFGYSPPLWSNWADRLWLRLRDWIL